MRRVFWTMLGTATYRCAYAEEKYGVVIVNGEIDTAATDAKRRARGLASVDESRVAKLRPDPEVVR